MPSYRTLDKREVKETPTGEKQLQDVSLKENYRFRIEVLCSILDDPGLGYFKSAGVIHQIYSEQLHRTKSTTKDRDTQVYKVVLTF